MPADLHNHAHHADGGEQDAAAYCTDGYRGDRNNQRQYAQPRHQRDDKRHVPFAVKIVGQHAQQHGQQDDGGDQPEHRGQKVCCCGTAGHAMLRAVEGAAGACFVELRARSSIPLSLVRSRSASLLPPFSRSLSQVCRMVAFHYVPVHHTQHGTGAPPPSREVHSAFTCTRTACHYADISLSFPTAGNGGT